MRKQTYYLTPFKKEIIINNINVPSSYIRIDEVEIIGEAKLHEIPTLYVEEFLQQRKVKSYVFQHATIEIPSLHVANNSKKLFCDRMEIRLINPDTFHGKYEIKLSIQVFGVGLNFDGYEYLFNYIKELSPELLNDFKRFTNFDSFDVNDEYELKFSKFMEFNKLFLKYFISDNNGETGKSWFEKHSLDKGNCNMQNILRYLLNNIN